MNKPQHDTLKLISDAEAKQLEARYSDIAEQRAVTIGSAHQTTAKLIQHGYVKRVVRPVMRETLALTDRGRKALELGVD